MELAGRILLGVAVVAAIAGGILLLLGKFGLSSLPGDISVGKGNWRIYFPLGTSILISVIASILLSPFFRSR
ncbi:MAG: DUF2905 domain-containing protein [Actinomycetota bacterium]